MQKKKKKDKHKKGQETPQKGKKGAAKKGKDGEQEKWKWWEEDRVDDGTKWKFLEHKGPVFAPEYEPLPDHVKFYYEGKPVSCLINTTVEIHIWFYVFFFFFVILNCFLWLCTFPDIVFGTILNHQPTSFSVTLEN